MSHQFRNFCDRMRVTAPVVLMVVGGDLMLGLCGAATGLFGMNMMRAATDDRMPKHGCDRQQNRDASPHMPQFR